MEERKAEQMIVQYAMQCGKARQLQQLLSLILLPLSLANLIASASMWAAGKSIDEGLLAYMCSTMACFLGLIIAFQIAIMLWSSKIKKLAEGLKGGKEDERDDG
jgi:hypothetical protein